MEWYKQLLVRNIYLIVFIFHNGFTYAGQTINSVIPTENFIALSAPIGTLNADGSVTYATTDYNISFVQMTNILNNSKF